MRYLFFTLLLILFFSSAFLGDKKLRKDEYCKEGLFFQMLLNKCTPRKFLYDNKEQQNI